MPSTPNPLTAFVRSAPRRRAFTLIELLVVISIIAILSGMVFAGVTIAKRSMMKTKTQSILGQLSAAIVNYRTQSNGFPGDPPGFAWNDVFSHATNSSLNAATFDPDTWKTGNSESWAPVTAEALAKTLESVGETDLVRPSSSGYLQDSYKQTIRYRPARLYPFIPAPTSPNTAYIKIDSDEPPNRDSYQLWSIGEDKKDQGGETPGDDLVQWAR